MYRLAGKVTKQTNNSDGSGGNIYVYLQVRPRVYQLPEVHVSLRRLGVWSHSLGNVQLRLPALGSPHWTPDTRGHR